METKKDLAAKIIAMEKDALKMWNEGNPSGYLSLLSSDITYFDPFQEKRIDGFDKMNAFYESLRGKGSVDRSEIIDPVVQITEDMAVLSYNLHSYSGEKAFKWNCTEVYRRQPDGEWKIIHNHWSFTRPMDMQL